MVRDAPRVQCRVRSVARCTAFRCNMNLFSFLSQYLNENNFCLTNILEGKGLKHYGCELFSAIAPSSNLYSEAHINFQSLAYFLHRDYLYVTTCLLLFFISLLYTVNIPDFFIAKIFKVHGF